MQENPVLVTGAVGFIGFHVARRLLQGGRRVVGLDSINAYYDVRLKEARLAELAQFPAFRFAKLDLASRVGMAELFAKERYPFVVHNRTVYQGYQVIDVDGVKQQLATREYG